MSEDLKKGLIIAAAVIAVLAAVGMGVMFLGGDKMQVINKPAPPPPGWKSMKEREMEAQSSQTGQAAQHSEGRSGDLSGPLPGQ